MSNTRITIQVASNKPVDKYSDNHILIYDSVKRQYQMREREEFLAPQNEKIKNLEDKLNQTNENFKKYESEINAKFSDFLKTYQETNKKLINMVKGELK